MGRLQDRVGEANPRICYPAGGEREEKRRGGKKYELFGVIKKACCIRENLQDEGNQ